MLIKEKNMRPHISLNVSEIEKSVAFYERMFGVKPQKLTSSYAKFDLKEPALNFSMHVRPDGLVSKVSHLGVEVDSSEELEKWETKLKNAGLIGSEEKNTNCCYARQDKVWFQDPDGNAWEVFVVHE